MNYRKMIENAKKEGYASEATMWTSVDSMSALLNELKDGHPDLYWKFVRKQHGVLYGNHYDSEFADYDIAKLSFTDHDGKERSGAHWTREQVKEATKGMSFPGGTTENDKYVAFNATYADFCKHFSEEQILQIGYDFWFADEDWPTKTKVWEYFGLAKEMSH